MTYDNHLKCSNFAFSKSIYYTLLYSRDITKTLNVSLGPEDTQMNFL